MVKKLKVYLLASPHPQFDEIIDAPPEGVTYKINRTKARYHGWFTENRIKLHKLLLNVFPVPRMAQTKTDADIIHSTRGIIQVNQRKPWIIDLEAGPIFTSFNMNALKNPIVRKMIIDALASKSCKKILPQSEAANRTLHEVLDCSKFEHKIEVMYLTMRPCKMKRIQRKDKKVILSYLGVRSFYGKGGPSLLKAYSILTKKYKNLELRFKGNIPPEHLKFAKTLPGFKHIEGHFPRDELFKKMYLSTDIFVLPTSKDNYGVVFLEAMSAGLPLVATTSMTVPELIEEGKNGFLIKTDLSHERYYNNGEAYLERIKHIHPHIVDQLVEKLSILIEDKKLREKMGKESRKMIEDDNGKFSTVRRNKQLRRIYDEALK